MPAERLHWLVTVVRAASLDGSDQLVIPEHTPPSEAWPLAARACHISQDELAAWVAEHFKLPVADLRSPSPHALRLVPEKVARRHTILALRENDQALVFATSDPTDDRAQEDVGFAAGRSIAIEIAAPGPILDSLQERYGQVSKDELFELDNEALSAVEVVEELKPDTVEREDIEAAPVIRLTNIILRDGVKARASDIHIEPGPRDGVVRFRVDGVLHSRMRLPMRAFTRVVTRIKVMGKLDIADRLRPQDGRARIVVENQTVDLRISTVPTREAEKAVIRLLGQDGAQKLPDIGLDPGDLGLIRTLAGNRNGIVIVTGPTGSGKTTTLYGIVRELANGEVNVMTVEDPIEYDVAGITQIQVEPKRNVTFATALRAVLRQDPDVVLVGEIRDLETAQIAVQASMTGHLVLATLHTNDAAGAVARLVDLGVDRQSIATCLRGVIAQRLMRKACTECARPASQPFTPDEDRLAGLYGAVPTLRAVGCPRCAGTGYRGRLPVLEILTMSPQLVDKVTAGAVAPVIARAARDAGMRDLLDGALELARSGKTTLKEVERVIGDPAEVRPVAAVRTSEAPVKTSPSGSEKQASENATAIATPSTPHVLLVDDDPVHRGIAMRLLQKQGFDVDEASSGSAAIEKAGAEDYNLVITDLHMPGLGGREIIACLRALPRTARVPIVIATSDEDGQMEIELMEAGADDYIRKPIDPARFSARIRAALRRAAA